MIIYEVNLIIKKEIYHEFFSWLLEHIEAMLKFPGFNTAEVAEENSLPDEITDEKKLTVRYSLASQPDLDNYLNTHALIMREEGLSRFGNQFSAYRRIFSKRWIKSSVINCS